MSESIRKLIDCTGKDHADRSLATSEDEVEFERLDRQVGRNYLPMDVYVDTKTVKEHFRVASIRARWNRSHSHARHDH